MVMIISAFLAVAIKEETKKNEGTAKGTAGAFPKKCHINQNGTWTRASSSLSWTCVFLNLKTNLVAISAAYSMQWCHSGTRVLLLYVCMCAKNVLIRNECQMCVLYERRVTRSQPIKCGVSVWDNVGHVLKCNSKCIPLFSAAWLTTSLCFFALCLIR